MENISRLVTFVAGDEGSWRIVRMETPVGAPLAKAERVKILDGPAGEGAGRWALRGVTSNERYVTRSEKIN